MTAVRSVDPSPEISVPSHPCGLGALLALVDGVEVPLPLAEVRVRTSIAGDVARTVVEQDFHNAHAVPLEAVHLFPLPEDGAVVEMELRAGETVVRGECKERQAAEAEFAEARASGHRAALLTQERADVHTLRVTRIPPGEAVRVRLVVVERLERVDGTYRWRFPTVIAPRYLSGQPIGHDGPGVLPATDRVPDADRLQPPLRLAGGTRLDLEVEIAGPVRRLAVAQHAVRMDLDGQGVRLAPSASATLDRDFVLAFATAEADTVISRAWTDGSHTLVVVEPPSAAFPPPLPRDATFVVDISGSMEGVKMVAAKRALTAALHGLVAGDRFRLIAFDDRVEPMSPDFVAYDEHSLKRADAWIAGLSARGGTEMLPAIQEALRPNDTAGRSRSVLFITDGQAWNEAELTAAVANRRQGARFFTFGIDTAVNGALLKRLARVGGGTCELATPSDDIEEVLANLEARFGSPLLEGVAVEGLSSARLSGEAVFTGRPATLLVEGAAPSLTVTARGATETVRFPVAPQRVDFPLGALWARDRIAALEDRLVLKPFEEEALRPEIVRLALAWSVASRFTAFVAVDRGRVVPGPLHEQVQPAEMPDQWAMGGGGAPASPPAPSGAPARRMRSAAAPSSLARPAPMKAKKEAAPGRSLFSRMADAIGFGAGAADDDADASGSFAPMDLEESAEADFAAMPAPAPSAPPARMSPPNSLRADESSREEAPAQQAADPASDLARTQGADGSWGADVARTAAALLTLILLGHTRRTGSRRRVVLKASVWLQQHGSDPLAQLALAALDAAERGENVAADDAWRPLYAAGHEGSTLATRAGMQP